MKKILIIGVIIILVIIASVLFNSHQDWRDIFKVTSEIKHSYDIGRDIVSGTLENTTNYRYDYAVIYVKFFYNAGKKEIVRDMIVSEIKENETKDWFVLIPDSNEHGEFDRYEIDVRYKK